MRSLLGIGIAILGFGCGSDGGGENGADAGPNGDAGPDQASVFDESQIRTFALTIAQADWDFLNENATLEQYVPGRLEYDGEVLDQIGVRYKGAVGSLALCFDQQGNRICDKLSIKLKFGEYVANQRLRGLKRINLHSMQSDPSKMHDAIGYKLFRDANVYAPRTSYARVVVNGELIGLFIAVEAIDGVFARQNFPDGGEGNVYKEVWPVHQFQQGYIDALKTNEDQNPSVEKIMRFAADVMAADDATFAQTMSRWTDVDMLMRMMAVARLIDHWDDIVAWYCGPGGFCGNHNFYWYESTTEDKLWLIPWDLDNTFQEPSPVRTFFGMPDWDVTDADCAPMPIFLGVEGRAPACDPIIRGMAIGLYDRYLAESAALIASAFSDAALDARITELEALIRDAIAEDPDVTPAEFTSAVAELRTAADAKRAYVEAKLP